MGLFDKLRTGKAPTVLDPVCGMRIEPSTAAGTSTHNGKTVHFCSAGCKQKFDANPDAYASKLANA